MQFVQLKDGTLLNLAQVVMVDELPSTSATEELTHQVTLVTGQTLDITTEDYNRISNRLSSLRLV